MKINYLKLMEKTPVIDDVDNEGVSEEKILQIEIEIGNKFPLAFKEFLFLGGNSANMIADMDNGLFLDDDPYWKETQQICKEEMVREGVKTDKDFWVFAEADGGEQFHFIYFDEGDDPPVYYYCSFHQSDDGTEYAGIEKLTDKFSDYVNLNIDEKKKGGY